MHPIQLLMYVGWNGGVGRGRAGSVLHGRMCGGCSCVCVAMQVLTPCFLSVVMLTLPCAECAEFMLADAQIVLLCPAQLPHGTASGEAGIRVHSHHSSAVPAVQLPAPVQVTVGFVLIVL